MSILTNYDYWHNKAFDIILDKSVNVDLSHRCLLQCPMCVRQAGQFGREQVKLSGTMYGDMTLENAKDIGNTFANVTLCGQISDPIYHKDFLNLFEELLGTSCRQIDIHTTASHKKNIFWQELLELCSSTNKTIRFIFGIDGIDEKSAIHRVNQKTDDAFNAMKTVAKFSYDNKHLNIETVWQYICYKYAQDDLPKARKMAEEMKVEFMLLMPTSFNEFCEKSDV